MSYSKDMEIFRQKSAKVKDATGYTDPNDQPQQSSVRPSPNLHQALIVAGALEEERSICWMCRSWSKEKYMVSAVFEGHSERICLNCAQALAARDVQMEALYSIMHPEEVDDVESQDTGQSPDQSGRPLLDDK